ncbi:MAG: Ig-like domain-containing protein [Nitrososphaeria archaeon]|nr:Ig-like domain-containing protein [Nitrososphaeria archaeon]
MANKSIIISVVAIVVMLGISFIIFNEIMSTPTYPSFTTTQTTPTTTTASTHTTFTTTTQGISSTTTTRPTSTTTSTTTVIPRNYPAVRTPPSMWTELHPTGTAPEPRSMHASVYDAKNDILIVFGGRGSSQCFNDTWLLLNPSGVGGEPSWKRLPTSGNAPQRFEMLAGYNSMKNMLIIFGGADKNNYIQMDLWILSNANGLGKEASTWRRLDISGTPPETRGCMGGVYDEENDMFIFFGGGVWRGSQGTIFDETWAIISVTENPTWRKLNPSGTLPVGRIRHSAVYDTISNSMIIFGGNPSTANPPSYLERRNDTWIMSNANGLSGTPSWKQIVTLLSPPSREGHTAVIDSVNKRVIVFGGAGVDRYVRNDVWILADIGEETVTWVQYETGTPRPTARVFHSAVYTGTEKNMMIVFGGDAGGGKLLNDVWILRIANGVPSKPPSKVTIEAASSILHQGYTLQLSTVATDESGKEVEGILYFWSTSNPNVATVSPLGLVKGVGPGTATITVSAVGFGIVSQFTVTILASPTTTTTIPPWTTTSITTTTTTGIPPTQAEKWEGTITIISTSSIEDGWKGEFGSSKVEATILLWINRDGKEIWGTVSCSNIKETILFNYAPLDYQGVYLLPQYDIEGTINPDGSITFTNFMGYGPVKVNVTGNTMSAKFEFTSRSDMPEIIILQLPGQQSQTVTGYVETHDIVSFEAHKIS